MILCEKEDAFALSLTLKCSKMKDDEPFRDFVATLEKVKLPNGASFPVLGEAFDIIASSGEVADKIVEILVQKFSEVGANNGEFLKAFCSETGKSKSTFDRTWREPPETLTTKSLLLPKPRWK